VTRNLSDYGINNPGSQLSAKKRLSGHLFGCAKMPKRSKIGANGGSQAGTKNRTPKVQKTAKVFTPTSIGQWLRSVDLAPTERNYLRKQKFGNRENFRADDGSPATERSAQENGGSQEVEMSGKKGFFQEPDRTSEEVKIQEEGSPKAEEKINFPITTTQNNSKKGSTNNLDKNSSSEETLNEVVKKPLLGSTENQVVGVAVVDALGSRKTDPQFLKPWGPTTVTNMQNNNTRTTRSTEGIPESQPRENSRDTQQSSLTTESMPTIAAVDHQVQLRENTDGKKENELPLSIPGAAAPLLHENGAKNIEIKAPVVAKNNSSSNTGGRKTVDMVYEQFYQRWCTQQQQPMQITPKNEQSGQLPLHQETGAHDIGNRNLKTNPLHASSSGFGTALNSPQLRAIFHSKATCQQPGQQHSPRSAKEPHGPPHGPVPNTTVSVCEPPKSMVIADNSGGSPVFSGLFNAQRPDNNFTASKPQTKQVQKLSLSELVPPPQREISLSQLVPPPPGLQHDVTGPVIKAVAVPRLSPQGVCKGNDPEGDDEARTRLLSSTGQNVHLAGRPNQELAPPAGTLQQETPPPRVSDKISASQRHATLSASQRHATREILLVADQLLPPRLTGAEREKMHISPGPNTKRSRKNRSRDRRDNCHNDANNLEEKTGIHQELEEYHHHAGNEGGPAPGEAEHHLTQYKFTRKKRNGQQCLPVEFLPRAHMTGDPKHNENPNIMVAAAPNGGRAPAVGTKCEFENAPITKNVSTKFVSTQILSALALDASTSNAGHRTTTQNTTAAGGTGSRIITQENRSAVQAALNRATSLLPSLAPSCHRSPLP